MWIDLLPAIGLGVFLGVLGRKFYFKWRYPYQIVPVINAPTFYLIRRFMPAAEYQPPYHAYLAANDKWTRDSLEAGKFDSRAVAEAFLKDYLTYP